MESSLTEDKRKEVILTPMHRLPILIVLIGIFILLMPLPLWIGVLTGLFGIFLLIQSFTLKIKFTSEALVVLQLSKEIRCFPFSNWIAWRIFFPELPGILYFRETASPHLLPILFDRVELENQLKSHVGNLEIKTE